VEGYKQKIATRLAGLWNRLQVRNKYDLLYDELRNLEFFLIVSEIGCCGYIFTLFKFAQVVERDQFLVFLEHIFFLIQALISLWLFHISKKKIIRLKKDFQFINSSSALLIIEGIYLKANSQFRSMLKSIFPAQLRDF
jgi:hypothetical protein